MALEGHRRVQGILEPEVRSLVDMENPVRCLPLSDEVLVRELTMLHAVAPELEPVAVHVAAGVRLPGIIHCFAAERVVDVMIGRKRRRPGDDAALVVTLANGPDHVAVARIDATEHDVAFDSVFLEGLRPDAGGRCDRSSRDRAREGRLGGSARSSQARGIALAERQAADREQGDSGQPDLWQPPFPPEAAQVLSYGISSPPLARTPIFQTLPQFIQHILPPAN